MDIWTIAVWGQGLTNDQPVEHFNRVTHGVIKVLLKYY